MLLIEFRYTKPAYYAGVINNSLGLRTLAKFDSGAAISIIGIERFGIELQEQQFINFFMKYVRENDIVKKVYMAANEQEIETYPCILDKMSIDGTEFDNFRFGLVITQKSNRFLLGDDFISCCDFNHTIGGSIKINNYLYAKYAASARNIKFADLNLIFKMYKQEL